MMPLFRDAELQSQFDERGFVKIRVLDESVVREISEYCDHLGLGDELRAGYKVSLYSDDPEKRRLARDFLIEAAFPNLAPFLVNRRPYLASYLVKEPSGTIVSAHQDWSHCDEDTWDPATCWFPLCDVDRDNGTLGFIKGSHRYFDYLRGFPYMVAETPVYVHSQQISTYFDLVDMKMGEAVVFNNKTFHGSFSNYSDVDRKAFALLLHPVGEPLYCYYLKPDARKDVLLRYTVDPHFYLENNQPKFAGLYQRGEIIETEKCIEIPYPLEPVEWPDLEAKLISSGNRRDQWQVNKIKNFSGKRIP